MPSKREIGKQITILRKAREAKTLCHVGGVIVTEKTAKEYREQFCRGCARKKKNPTLYFGELFCSDCVEKWKAGKK